MTFISFTTRPLKQRVCYRAHNNSFYVSAYVVTETVLRANVYYALWRFASSCHPRGFKGINIFLLYHFALYTIGFSVFKGMDCLSFDYKLILHKTLFIWFNWILERSLDHSLFTGNWRRNVVVWNFFTYLFCPKKHSIWKGISGMCSVLTQSSFII